jgi:hypothetical protein
MDMGNKDKRRTYAIKLRTFQDSWLGIHEEIIKDMYNRSLKPIK